MVEVKTDMKDMNLRDMSEQGFIRFSIKADDTEENEKVHNAFKEFCRIETDNNYTQGIRKLLEYYQGDFKYELLGNEIQRVESALQDLKSSVVEMQKTPKNEEENTDAF